MTGDLGMYDVIEVEMAIFTDIVGSTVPVCYRKDDDTYDSVYYYYDQYSSEDIPAATGGSYSYDVSICGTDTPSLTINMFSDADCSVPVGSEVEEPKFCYFDYQHFVEEITMDGSSDIFYDVQTCLPASL
jgi:hypothetical protein